MAKNEKKTALITGASTGIGYELCKLFAQDKYNLVIIARDLEKLKEVAGELEEKYNIFAKVIVKDLSVPNSPQEIFDEIISEDIHVDVLVNNAGFAEYGSFLETSIEKELNMIQVNISSLTHLCKLFSRKMSQNGGGRILNVASTAAFQPGPLMAVYYATKSYVLNFSEALANELKDKKINVTTLCPGPTETNFQERANLENSRLMKSKKIKVMNAATVAKEGYDSLKEGKNIVIPGTTNKILAFGAKLLPKTFAAKLAYNAQKGIN